MLINRVSEVNDRGEVNTDRVDDHNQEYQTASEIFEIMSKDHYLDVADTLIPSDIVLLYKNLDLGANLVSESTIMPKRNNQHIETVVYEDDPDSEDSDISEIYNTDDVNVYDCNKERLDILNNRPSCGNSLCQKLGGIEIQSTKLKDYHQHFNILQDSFLQDQLNYNLGFENYDGAVLPATLLDYICCKRLEDNYNFYMDNIIRYVKHTIEQLKRISNGDYLTDKAKEKWREVSNPVDQNSTKILATSTSIPLHIERKTSNHMSAWDDIVHSEVDVRSLSKILEKKIIVEVPKLICGTYKLFSRRCADNLIISCKRENDPIEEEKEGSRVDVVLQLEKSQSGQVVSNISSIMVLKTQPEISAKDRLTLPYEDVEESFFDAKDSNSTSKLQIVEIIPDGENFLQLVPKVTQEDTYVFNDNYFNDQESRLETHNDTNEYPCSENDNVFSKNHSFLESSESNYAFKDTPYNELDPHPGSSNDAASTDDLQLTMQTCNMPSSLPEESGDDVSQNTLNKKKSPTRIRIKSPYENQSHILEEKKRRRLLEIREKRERKKLALSENCKISKHKYARGGILPQASSSVTKLSITNKSFYNSIYGQTVVDGSKTKNRKGGKNDVIPEVPLDNEGEHDAPLLTSDTKKYMNRSYYLDDMETEMMYMEKKNNESSKINACSASTSVESSDFRANLTLLSQLIGPSVTDLNAKLNQAISEEQILSPNETTTIDVKDKDEPNAIGTTKSKINLAPANTPKYESTGDNNDPRKASSSVECRKSIDKIYDLMKKLENGDGDERDVPTSKLTAIPTDRVNTMARRVSSTIQGSDSGTSLKHQLTSSNPSCFSFEKTNIEVPKLETLKKEPEIPVVPKVIISNKVQIIKPDGEKNKKPKRSITSPTLKTQDNPLKAISQLLHEFDNVQKCRQKTCDSKTIKKHEVTSNDVKSISCQGSSKRRSRLELHLRETEVLERPKVTSPRKLKTSLGFIKNFRQPVITEDNHDKVTKRKINDIIDEVKEARGEAVKGPSKFNSRLNSLAQPKKSYVQARIDEHPFRPAKAPPERQQKLAMAPLVSERIVGSVITKNKPKRTGTEATSSVCIKQPPVQPLEKTVRKRRSANSSPEDTSKPTSPVSSSKRNNVPPTPETLKKMVAVESYVKSNYRRAPPTSPLRDRPLLLGHKSRIPLLPKDIELVNSSITSANTVEESTEVGSKLHCMISTMLDVTPDRTFLSEKHEICCKKTDQSIAKDLCKSDERASVDSDYPVDVFEDKHIVTAVESVSDRPTADKINESSLEVVKSTTEIQKLQNALCRKWPIGAFQKRLRIKNLTLTPKHSMQQVFVLQSGDAGSLVIKSSLSKSINLDTSQEMHDFKVCPVLSKTELDWGFTNFPTQIATVGYAFSQCQSPFEPNSKIKSLDNVDRTTEPLQNTVESPDFKAIFDEPKPILDEIAENERNSDESSIPALKLKLENGKVDPIKCTVDTKPKSCENTNEICLKMPDRGELVIQKTDLNNIDYTTSLDMLVGLLNEIQKITSCQSHITNNAADVQSCKELEFVLDDAAALEASSNPKELVSIASLDKLRKLESHPSIDTIYLSSDEENDNESKNLPNVTTDACQPVYVDKEINVDIDVKEYINRFTDVPSIFPLNSNRSTSVTNSLIGVLSQPSSQSIFSFMEYQTLYSNSSYNTYKKIVQLPQRLVDETKVNSPKHCVAVCKDKEKLNEKVAVNTYNLALPCKGTAKETNQKLIRCKKVAKKESHIPRFDPMLKMKRDILVTVYSILVLTVFAALSFPDVVYHV